MYEIVKYFWNVTNVNRLASVDIIGDEDLI